MTAGIRHNLMRLREWRRSARFVQQRGGKGFVRQACEIASLRLGSGKISGREYYTYELYDDQGFSPMAKRRFLGARQMAILYKRLNQGTGTASLTISSSSTRCSPASDSRILGSSPSTIRGGVRLAVSRVSLTW
jgi:hypothetical protein